MAKDIDCVTRNYLSVACGRLDLRRNRISNGKRMEKVLILFIVAFYWVGKPRYQALKVAVVWGCGTRLKNDGVGEGSNNVNDLGMASC